MKFVLRICFILMMILSSFWMWFTLAYPTSQANPPVNQETKDAPKEHTHMVHIKRNDGSVDEVELETYLIGVVASEMKVSFALEALKAQAVAARTFVVARNFEVDDTSASQVYRDEQQLKEAWSDQYETYHDKISQAVSETKGKVLTYQGAYITAAFFSSCNGYTNNSEDYWKNAQPYLRSVESPWDVKIEGNVQSVSFTRAELANALGFAQPITSIQPPIRYDNGYVKSVAIDGIIFTGRELREALQLRSSAFEITVKEGEVLFTTHGFGHGIGMSQYGADAMAQAGATYEEILHHYYTDVEISDL